MIWRVRNLEVLLILRLVELHETELGEAVLKAYTIQPNTPHLNSYAAFTGPTRIQLLEPGTLNFKLTLCLPQEVIALTCLLLIELRDLERSQDSCYRKR